MEVRWPKRALHFDLGHNNSLGLTRLLRANKVLVSHTHIDPFIGFDAVLGVALGQGKPLRLFDPLELIDNMHGKLLRNPWSLVDGYPLTIEVMIYRSGRGIGALGDGKISRNLRRA